MEITLIDTDLEEELRGLRKSLETAQSLGGLIYQKWKNNGSFSPFISMEEAGILSNFIWKDNTWKPTIKTMDSREISINGVSHIIVQDPANVLKTDASYLKIMNGKFVEGTAYIDKNNNKVRVETANDVLEMQDVEVNGALSSIAHRVSVDLMRRGEMIVVTKAAFEDVPPSNPIWGSRRVPTVRNDNISTQATGWAYDPTGTSVSVLAYVGMTGYRQSLDSIWGGFFNKTSQGVNIGANYSFRGKEKYQTVTTKLSKSNMFQSRIISSLAVSSTNDENTFPWVYALEFMDSGIPFMTVIYHRLDACLNVPIKLDWMPAIYKKALGNLILPLTYDGDCTNAVKLNVGEQDNWNAMITTLIKEGEIKE